MSNATDPPKAPRWINTEAGQAAWREHPTWRGNAVQALSVQERMRLLDEAERWASRWLSTGTVNEG